MFWQKAVEALSRAYERRGEALARTSGDGAQAARLLWEWSRHDEALREDLIKAACVLLKRAGYLDAWARSTEAERHQALGRLANVRRAQELAAAAQSCLRGDAAAAAEAGVSARTVGAWRYRCRHAPEWMAAAALLDRKRTGRPPSIGPAGQEVLRDLLLKHGRRLTARRARRELEARCGEAPGIHTIRRHLRRLRSRTGVS